MKKIIYLLLLLLALVLAVCLWIFAGPATSFNEPYRYLYIRSGKTAPADVMNTLRNEQLISRSASFEWLANNWEVWSRIRPGKYKITKGSSLIALARILRNRRQEEVNLVITKLRTRQDLAALVAKKFECDSASFIGFINNADSIKSFGVDTNTVMTLVVPNTYSYYWTATPRRMLQKLEAAHRQFWTEERLQQAKVLQLSPAQVYTLASIVEEETLKSDEKPVIASVYLNRLRKNMPLGADPTVKFAVGDFSLKRILFVHINSTAASPYNTYKNKGLPPGPICTPQPSTIDAVLRPANTNYLFFCAQPGGTGRHAFAATDAEHLKNAKAYQQWLNNRGIR